MKKTLSFFLLISFFVSGFFFRNAAAEEVNLAAVKNIEYQKTEAGLEVVMAIQGVFNFQHFELDDPARLVIDISPAKIELSQPLIEINHLGISGVRIGDVQPGTVRVVFDLSESLPPYEIIQDEPGIRVVFSKESKEAGQTPEVPAETPEEEEKEAEIEKTQLNSVRFEKIGSQFKVNINIQGNYYSKVTELISSEKLILDLWPIHAILAQPSLLIQDPELKEMTIEQIDPETARLKFFLSEHITSIKIAKDETGLEVTFTIKETPPAAKEVKKEDYKKIQKLPPKKEAVSPKALENTLIGFSWGGYQIPTDLFNQVYGTGGSIFAFDLSRIVFSKKNTNLALSLEGRYYSKTGASTVTKEETKFSIYPVSFSAKSMVFTENFVPFFGIGADYYSYKEESPLHETSGSAFGYHIQGGTYYQIPSLKGLKLKVYLKLTKAVANENNMDVELGGMEFGIGFTYGFNILNTKKSAR